MTVHLPETIRQQINRHAEKDYPYECCGFMLGYIRDDVRHITELRIQDNERENSKENRFLISPEAFRDAERYATNQDLDMLGVYHSHPDHPADPSEFDRTHAWPWYTYIIISVNDGNAGNLKAWQLHEDRSGYFELEVVNETHKQKI